MLDEMAAIGRENLDAQHVARYDDKEDADAAGELQLLLDAGVDPESCVVDLGAGTGQFALLAAGTFRRVVAVDPSPVMLDRLRAKAAAIGSPLDVVEAGFLTYEHAGERPALVYTRYALHHLPDFWKAVALRRMRELLEPGGLLRLWDVVYGFGLDEVDMRVEAWCATGSVGDGEWSRAELEEHVRDESSTFTWLLEPMIERAGFAVRDARYSDDGFFARYLLVAE
jgi:SAM-dependent methyltransferase